MYTGETYEETFKTHDYVSTDTAAPMDAWPHLSVNAPVHIPTGLFQKASDHNLWLRIGETLLGLTLIAIAYISITGRGTRGKV